ncbi:C6 transcription factor [Apiospora arundinis]
MTQPVQIEEHASLPSRIVQARMMMEEAVKMRNTADFGESPCIPGVLASFFLFACLFGSNQHRAAWHKLREAVDLACSLGMQDPTVYDTLAISDREQWIRIYLMLSVTERAYALQRRHPIGFRGRPSLFAEMMQGCSSTGITGLISEEKADSTALTGLLYLMESFNAIDENIIGCWNGHCHITDGQCSNFDRRHAIKAFRALRIAREASLSGTLSIALSVSPLPLPDLGETQDVDITMTQLWLLNRLWNLCSAHQFILKRSEHIELSSDFLLYVAEAALLHSRRWDMRSMEVHGVGLAEKIFDISMGALATLRQLPSFGVSVVDTVLDRSRTDYSLIPASQNAAQPLTVGQTVQGLEHVLQDFRNGQHPYAIRFSAELGTIPSLQ